MLNEQEGLWYRVLKARYGEEGGRWKEGGVDCSVWWRMVSVIRSGVGTGEGRWFEENVRKVVGSGGNTLFCTENWVGGRPLRDRFSRLFDLAADKGVTVAEMSRRGWEEGEAWLWRRRLFAWEEESAKECSSLLHNIVMQQNTVDKWRWLLDPINIYNVKGIYHFLTMAEPSPHMVLCDDIW